MPRHHSTKKQYTTKRNLLPSLKSIYVEVRLRELDSTMDHGKRVRLARDEYEYLFCNADPNVRKQLESDFYYMHIGFGIPFASVADIAQGAAATAGSALWNLIGTDQVIPLYSSLFGMITDVAVRVFGGGSGMSARKRKELAEAAAGAAGVAAEEVVAATAAAATVASEATKGVPLVNLNTQNIMQKSLLHDKDRFTEYVADSSKMAATSFDSYAANQTSAAMPNATSGIPTQAAEATSNRGLLGTIFDTSSTIVSVISTAIYAYEAYQYTVNAWDSMKKTGIRARVNDAIYTSVALSSLVRTGLLQYAIGNYANFLDPLQTGAAGVTVYAGFIVGAWVIGAYLRYRTSRQIGSALPIVGIPLGGGIVDGGRRSLFNWDSDLPKIDFSTGGGGGLGSLISIYIHFAPKVQLNLDAQISAFNKQNTEDPLRDDETFSTKEITPQGHTLHTEYRALAHCIGYLKSGYRNDDGIHYYNIKIIRALQKACVSYSMLAQEDQETSKHSNFGHSMLQGMTARVFRAYNQPTKKLYSRARINANIRVLEAAKDNLSKYDPVYEKRSRDAGYWISPEYVHIAAKCFGALLQPAYKDESNGEMVKALDERIAELRELQVKMFYQLEKAEPHTLIKVRNEENEAEEYLFFFDAAQRAFANIRDVNDHLGGLSWYYRIFSDEQRTYLSQPMLEIVETLRKDCLHAYEEFLYQWQTVVMYYHDYVIHMHIKKLITQMHATFEYVKGIDNEQEAFLNRLATLLQGPVFDQAVRLAVLSPFEGDKSDDDEKVVTPIDPVAPDADDDDGIDEDDNGETVTPKEEASAPYLNIDAPKQLLRDNFASVDAFLKSVYDHQDDNGTMLRNLLVGTVVAVRNPASDYITNPQQNQYQVVEYGEDYYHTLSLDNFIAQVYDMLSKYDTSGFWEKLYNLKWKNDEKGIPVFYDSENGNTAFFRGYFDAAERYVFATAGSAHHMILYQHFSALIRLRAFHQLLEGLVIFSRDPDSSIQSRTSDDDDDPLRKDLYLLKSIAMRSHVLRSAAIPVAMTVPSVDFISLQKANGPRALTNSADYALHTATAYTFLKCGFDRVLDRLVNDTSITEKFSDKVPVAMANLITQLYLELPTLSYGYAAYRNIINEKIHSEMIADLDDDNVINGSAGSFELNGEGSDRVNEVLAAFERIKERAAESNQYQDFEIEYLWHLESIGGRLAEKSKHTVESWNTLFSDEKYQDRFAITWGSWNLLSEYFLAFDEDALVNSYNPSNTQVLLQLLSGEDVCALLYNVLDKEDAASDEFKAALTAYNEKMNRLKVHLDAYISCGHINSEVEDLIIGSADADPEWDALYNEPSTEQGFKSFPLLSTFYRYAKEQVQKQRSLRNKSGYALQYRLADRSLQVKSEESLAIAWNVKQLQHEAAVIPFYYQYYKYFIPVNMFTSTYTRNSKPYSHLVVSVPSEPYTEENILLEENVDVVTAPYPAVFPHPYIEPPASNAVDAEYAYNPLNNRHDEEDIVFVSEDAYYKFLAPLEGRMQELVDLLKKEVKKLDMMNDDTEQLVSQTGVIRYVSNALDRLREKIKKLKDQNRVNRDEVHRRIAEQKRLDEYHQASMARAKELFDQLYRNAEYKQAAEMQAYLEKRNQEAANNPPAAPEAISPFFYPLPKPPAPVTVPTPVNPTAPPIRFQYPPVQPLKSVFEYRKAKTGLSTGKDGMLNFTGRDKQQYKKASSSPSQQPIASPKLTNDEEKRRKAIEEQTKKLVQMTQQEEVYYGPSAAQPVVPLPVPVPVPVIVPKPVPAPAPVVAIVGASKPKSAVELQQEKLERMLAQNPDFDFGNGDVF